MTMLRKLRVQLTFVCAVSTGLVLVAMAFVALLFTTSVLNEQAEKAFTTDVNSVLYYLNSQKYIDQSWLSKTEANSGLLIRVNIRDKDLVHTSHNPLRKALTDQAREYAREELGFDYLQRPLYSAQPEMVDFLLEADGAEYRAVVASVTYGAEWVGVTVLKSTDPENALLFRVRIVTALCVIAALGALILFSHRFIGYTLKPVEDNRKRQTEFVAAASHELRSPLAVMSASAGAIKRGTLEDAKGYADKIEAECTRLSHLTADLLKLASADSGTWQMNLSEVYPETVVIGLAERFGDVAAERGILLEVALPDIQFPVFHADAQRVEQALAILVDNALGYTPPGGTVKLGVHVQRKSICFTVADNGPGVPEGDRERIFDRFYRGDSARADKEHFGIGLSVAREIALLHKGSLYVRDAAGRGAEFVLKIRIGKD